MIRYAVCFLFCLLCTPAPAADTPLAVLRADKASLFADLLQTRQAKAFALDTRDYSGKLPGTDIEVDSLKSFLQTLADKDARDIRYTLTQTGATLAEQTAALAYTLPGETAPDTDTFPPPWNAFLARRDNMVGVLATSRPLLGLLALTTDTDLRAVFAEYNLRTPDTVQLELFNNAGDLGFEARLHNAVPKSDPPPPAETKQQIHLTFRKDALLELTLPAPDVLLRHLPWNPQLLAMANVDYRALTPQTITAAVWRKGDGSLAWATVALVPDAAKFRPQLRRAQEWLTALAPAFAIALPEITVAETDNGAAYVMAASSPEDRPDPRTIHKQQSTTTRLALYRAALDKEAASAMPQPLPSKDTGYLMIDGADLVLLSRTGLLPFLFSSKYVNFSKDIHD